MTHKLKPVALAWLLGLLLVLGLSPFESLTTPVQAAGSWTPPTTDPNYYYSYLVGAKVEPINIVVKGPAGTLDGLRMRLEATGKWQITGCFNPVVTFDNRGADFVMSDDFRGGPLGTGCGLGTRNHFRAWKQGQSDGSEVIYIAASLETLSLAYPVPPPDFPILPNVTSQGIKAYYGGRVAPIVGTDCTPGASPNVPKNWHFIAVLPFGSSLLNQNLTDGSTSSNIGTWHNGPCDAKINPHWPMAAQLRTSTSNGEIWDLYVAPYEAARDQNPSRDKTFNLSYLGVGSGTVPVQQCPLGINPHCLTEDSFNEGRDALAEQFNSLLSLDRGGGIAFTTTDYNAMNTAPIAQGIYTNFHGDGNIKVFNISSFPLKLTYGSTAPSVAIGTNCSSQDDHTGVNRNIVFHIENKPANYYPQKLSNGDGGVWREYEMGCSQNRNWPMLYNGSTDEVYLVPFGAVPEGSQHGYYILELGTGNAADPLIYAELVF